MVCSVLLCHILSRACVIPFSGVRLKRGRFDRKGLEVKWRKQTETRKVIKPGFRQPVGILDEAKVAMRAEAGGDSFSGLNITGPLSMYLAQCREVPMLGQLSVKSLERGRSVGVDIPDLAEINSPRCDQLWDSREFLVLFVSQA